MKIYENLQKLRKSMKIYENLRKSMKIYENLRKSKNIYENLRKSTKIDENLRKCVGFVGLMWAHEERIDIFLTFL